ncbi:hypothetical protein M6G62_25030, partial [Escherichia coli]|nr:hypothetical protein [Escherichia coli]
LFTSFSGSLVSRIPGAVHNGVRAAYIHKAEHLEERRLMLQWWADFLDANREKFISPFEYAKINNPLKQ